MQMLGVFSFLTLPQFFPPRCTKCDRRILSDCRRCRCGSFERMSKVQRSMQLMGTNIWAKPIRFGHALGVTNGNVVAYSSEYRSADERRFGDDSYESEVTLVVVHRDDGAEVTDSPGEAVAPSNGQQQLSSRVVVHYVHKVSESDPDHPILADVVPSNRRTTTTTTTDAADSSSKPEIRKKVFSVYAGAKFQCVEFARRFLIVNHHITFPSIPMAYHILLAMRSFSKIHIDHASVTSRGHTSSRDDVSLRSLDAVKSINGSLPTAELRKLNDSIFSSAAAADSGRSRGEDGEGGSEWLDSHHVPVVGSLLIWAPGGYFKHTGHVAAVVAVDSERVYIAEQNVTDCEWPEGRSYARSLPLVKTATTATRRGGAIVGIEEAYLSGVIWGWVTPRSLLDEPR